MRCLVEAGRDNTRDIDVAKNNKRGGHLLSENSNCGFEYISSMKRSRRLPAIYSRDYCLYDRFHGSNARRPILR